MKICPWNFWYTYDDKFLLIRCSILLRNIFHVKILVIDHSESFVLNFGQYPVALRAKSWPYPQESLLVGFMALYGIPGIESATCNARAFTAMLSLLRNIFACFGGPHQAVATYNWGWESHAWWCSGNHVVVGIQPGFSPLICLFDPQKRFSKIFYFELNDR